ncbi:MAG: cysteine peptidase family C39 domain-containing protein [Candidatus Moraniibacteriota bacterium]
MKLIKFPELRQVYDWDCGASVLQSVLAHCGVDIREEKIIKKAKSTKDGTSPDALEKVLFENNIKYKSGEMNIKDIISYLDRDMPIILLLQAWSNKEIVDWENNWKDGHYVVAIGYDKNKIYFEDPASISRTFLNFSELEERWHDVDFKGKKYIHWGIIIQNKMTSKKEVPVHME